MSRRLTRRRTLATVGSVVGSFTLAGCLESGTGSYWDDPPDFDDSGLESVTDRSVPDRPAVIPVDVTDDHLEGVADRVEDLLAPIPDPLSVETVPNGDIREAITSEREAARETLETIGDQPTTLETVHAAANACECAGTAAGVWAAISTTHSLSAVTLSESELTNEMSSLGEELPGEAPAPLEGSVVYGPIESWIDTAQRRTLTGWAAPGDNADPLREGNAVGDVERIHTQVEAGSHLRERYADSLAQSRPIEDDLGDALEVLESTVEDTFLAVHDADDVEFPQSAPPIDDVLSRDPPRDEPGMSRLSRELYDFFDEIRFEPVAWPGGTVSHPAHTLRTTFWALATLDALEAFAERVDDGDDLFPADAESLQDTRESAIDAVDRLVEVERPLERLTAARLVARFDDADAAVTAADPDLEAIAEAYTQYVWVETLADTTPPAAAVVEDALP